MIGKTNTEGGMTFPQLPNPATASDVLETKQIVDKNGNILVGNIPNRGNWNSSVGMNSYIDIPSGRHINSRVNGPSIAIMGGTNISPSTSAQTVWCANKYMIGDITIDGVPLPPANMLVEGYTYRGITGTARVFPSGPTDIYNRGNNPYNFVKSGSGGGAVESGQLNFNVINKSNVTYFITSSNVNFSGYRVLRIEHSIVMTSELGVSVDIALGDINDYISRTIGYLPTSVDITSYQKSGIFRIAIRINNNIDSTGTAKGPIFRIWLE